VTARPREPLRAPAILERKRDGQPLTRAEIEFLVAGYTRGDVPDYQMAAFSMAVSFRGMSDEETTDLTRAMLHSGEILDLSDLPGPKVDKHSTGGVGDKTSLILAPLAASCGVTIPMISGRALAHSGGTLDKLESIPGFRVGLSLDEFRKTLRAHQLSFIGQTAEIAPADKKLYALRDVTATVPVLPLIVASIMGKKLAEGIDALILDVKTGEGAFMQREEDSVTLAERMVAIGKGMGKRVAALITDMSEPTGRMIGNALEIEESILALRGQGPKDLTDLSVELAAWMLVLTRVQGNLEAARAKVREAIASGAGLEKFRRVIEAQGGDPRVCDDPSFLPRASGRREIRASSQGFVQRVSSRASGEASMLLGAGRNTVTDPIDPSVGIELARKVGDQVATGDLLATLHFNDGGKLDAALSRLAGAFEIGESPVPPRPLVRRVIE
jgi:pyrimidine-nucleoside phosphorylase/thymidine phosphorylase